MKILIPGNLLLLGEYAITRPNGLGVAVAVDRFVEITQFPAKDLNVTTSLGEIPRLLEPILKGIRHHLIDSSFLPKGHIHIDSSALYDPSGRKQGLGSSAAVCAGLTYLFLLEALGREPHLVDEVLPLAIQNHREFQKGKGSGYDVCASLLGGAGLFEGGVIPKWTPFELVINHQLALVKGEKEASTVSALDRYQQFLNRSPSKEKQFLRCSNLLVKSFTKASCAQRADQLLSRASHLNQWIHQQLDFPKQNEAPSFPSLLKWLGAGRELALTQPREESQHSICLNVTPRGLQCLPR